MDVVNLVVDYTNDKLRRVKSFQLVVSSPVDSYPLKYTNPPVTQNLLEVTHSILCLGYLPKYGWDLSGQAVCQHCHQRCVLDLLFMGNLVIEVFDRKHF